MIKRYLSRRIGPVWVAFAVILGLMTSGAGFQAAGASTSKPSVASEAVLDATSVTVGLGNPTPALCRGKKYTIGWDTFSEQDATAHQVSISLKAIAKRLGCIKVVELVDNEDPQTVVNNVQLFVNQHVNGVLLFNVLDSAAPAAYKLLEGAKIPYFSFIEPTPKSATSDYFNQNGARAGQQAGEALAAAAKKKWPGQKPYAIIGRFDESSSSKTRLDGTVEGIKSEYPGLPASHIISIDTKADTGVTHDQTLNVMALIPNNAKVIITAVNDDTTYASYEAYKSTGRSLNDVLVEGQGGANPSGLDYVCSNRAYVGAIGFFPNKYAAYAVPALLAEMNGVRNLPYPVLGPTAQIARNDIKKFYPSFKCHS